MRKPRMPNQYAARGSSIEDRLWLRSEPDANTGCQLWSGVADKDGYGQLWIKGVRFRAHRLAWASANGHIPPGMCVLHKCDTPACVNPNHLFVGTPADNNADRAAKGRTWNGGQQGERNVKAKLTAENVMDILTRLDAGERYASIARTFGVSDHTVCGINAGTAWGETTKRLPDDKVGNRRKGEWNGRAKLSATDVLTILDHLNKGCSAASVARTFGVDAPAIFKIRSG